MEAQVTFDVIKTTTLRQTQSLAKTIAGKLKGGEVIALYGELGSGKTVFVQGLAKALGIKTRILSPTFVFVRSYPIFVDHKKQIFHHIDLYRTDSLRDYQKLGLDELFSKDSIVAIEWAEKIKDFLPKKRIDVKLEIIDDDTRSIKISTPYSSSDREKRGNREVMSSWSGNDHDRISSSDSIVEFILNKRNRSFAVAQDDKIEGLQNDSGKFSINSNKKAAEILKKGGVIIFPTDTVYGISCRFDNQKAIERLYQIKGTPKNQPFPILVSNISQVKQLAKVKNGAQKLIDYYWPGGLTIILPSRHPERKRRIYSDSSAAPQNDTSKMGFRMPDSKLVRSLIEKVGVPIIGTSANFHGQKSPKSFDQLDPKLIKLADFVIKGNCQNGIESTVIDATTDPPIILRQGAVDIKRIN